MVRRELQLEEIGTSLPPRNTEIEGLEKLDARKPRAGISHPKSTARKSNDVHDDADIHSMVDDHADHEAYPDGLHDDTMLIDVPGIAPGTPTDPPDYDGVDLFFDGHDEDEMHGSLVLAGVYPEDAKTYCQSIVASAKPTTFFEVIGRGFIVQEAARARRNLNLKGLRAMDLRTMRKVLPGTSTGESIAMMLGNSNPGTNQPGSLVARLALHSLSGTWASTSRRWTPPESLP